MWSQVVFMPREGIEEFGVERGTLRYIEMFVVYL